MSAHNATSKSGPYTSIALRPIEERTERSHSIRPRAYVAEDNAEMRRIVATGLWRDGFDVVEVRDGSELLALIRWTPDRDLPDLIVSDIRMPGASGLEVLAELRAMRRTVAVILITAFGAEETHAEAERLGASILDKPFELSVLRRRALELVRRAPTP